MLSKELLSQMDLSRAQTLYIYETIEIIVVYKDKNLMLATFQIMMPSFECFNNN